MAVYNYWTSGLDWWTDTKNLFYASNETYSPVHCMMHHAANQFPTQQMPQP